MVAQYGRDARRHLPSRSVCRRQIDVPTTFLGAREPHVTAKWRHRIRARCASPQKATCVHAARGRGRSRGPWRARDATHVRTHAVGGGGRQRRCASPPVGGQPSRQRGTRSAPETGRKAGRKPSRQTRSFFLPRSHQLRPRAARAPPSETAAGGDPVQCASHSFFIES
jgi:hypothetical protein